MALKTDELQIVCVKDLVELNLKIPNYQRPYKWSKNSALTLFNDLYEAYINGLDEYRIGTVILHLSGNEYHIVDGQQRITTIGIFLSKMQKKPIVNEIANLEYNSLSFSAIQENARIISSKLNELDETTRTKFENYILEKCSLVKIVIEDNKNESDAIQEAFQFFDSQNTRGKSLEPHDLLKSYHLREMNRDTEEEKVRIVNKWESINQQQLSKMFEVYLYPLVQWYRYKSGYGYTSKNISTFKGVKIDNLYNYALYHKAANLFVEQINATKISELMSSDPLNQFQLTQPIISGKRFFAYVNHYIDLCEKVEKKIKNLFAEDERPTRRSGDIYVYQMFVCVAMFFADKFGVEHLSDAILYKLYFWSYCLRIEMQAVYQQTINRYAMGHHNRGIDINMFAYINDLNEPSEMDLLTFDDYKLKDGINSAIMEKMRSIKEGE